MSNSKSHWRKQRWGRPPQTLTPLVEGPDPDMQVERVKKESSWEPIREWFKIHKGISGNMSSPSFQPLHKSYDVAAKGQDLKLLLGVLGCPLAPIPDLLANEPLLGSLQVKNVPFETSTAHYIIKQYLAATGCLKRAKAAKNMYVTGTMTMSCCENEIAAGKSVKTLGGVGNGRCGESGCFVLWQMQPGMWSLELVLGGTKLISGSDGKTVWRHTSWLGTHVAKGPQRPLRRLIQGLDPKTTARLFSKAQFLGDRRIDDDDCFVLKVSADRDSLLERNDNGAPEIIRHTLYGYFSQKSGLLVYLEDSHLTRVMTISPEDEAVYWETTIRSSIGDYRDVDGFTIAHCGCAVATVLRFGETSLQSSRKKVEEIWRIDDVVFDVPGLSLDSFIPPADIFEYGNGNNVYSNVNSR